jgi:hypothetical protein
MVSGLSLLQRVASSRSHRPPLSTPLSRYAFFALTIASSSWSLVYAWNTAQSTTFNRSMSSSAAATDSCSSSSFVVAQFPCLSDNYGASTAYFFACLLGCEWLCVREQQGLAGCYQVFKSEAYTLDDEIPGLQRFLSLTLSCCISLLCLYIIRLPHSLRADW